MILSFSIGCLDNGEDDNEGDAEGDEIQRVIVTILGKEVDTFLYILQDINITTIIHSEYDLVIMDYSSDGTQEGAFSRDEILALRDSGKIVLSYISIGEAEDYRYYWQENWTVGDPEFIDSENPDWEGNYKVNYWEKGWQDIIFSGNNSYVDRIIDAGFQGAYLDIVDAYEFFQDGGGGGGRETAASDMVDFVLAIVNHSRQKDPDFLIVPQNGEGLVINESYLEAVSGQGKEDLFFDDDEEQDVQETDYSLQLLRNVSRSGKFILVTDYPGKENNIRSFHSKAFDEGFLAFTGNRDLDRIPSIQK